VFPLAELFIFMGDFFVKFWRWVHELFSRFWGISVCGFFNEKCSRNVPLLICNPFAFNAILHPFEVLDLS